MIEIGFAIVIVGVALFVRGMTGFGGSLIMVPFISLVWDIRQAVVIIAVLNLTSSLFLVIESRPHVAWRDALGLVAWSAPGLVLGTLALARVDVDLMTVVLGVFTILASVHLARQRAKVIETRPPHLAVEGAVGVMAGTLHGMLGTSGPVIVPYLAHRVRAGAALRATILAYLLSLDVLRLGGYVSFGLVSREVLVRSAILLPVAFIASHLGGSVQARLPERVFRLIVAGLLFASGIMLILR